MTNKVYAGIGARDTPHHILKYMTRIAQALDQDGYKLRTGGADGADTSFMEGTTPDKTQLFLPWKGYNGWDYGNWSLNENHMHAAWLAHPNWDACKPSVRKLHARNAKIILGQRLASPSKFVVCYTKNGNAIGGTGVAITMADTHLIPVFNLGAGVDRVMEELQDFLNLAIDWK